MSNAPRDPIGVLRGLMPDLWLYHTSPELTYLPGGYSNDNFAFDATTRVNGQEEHLRCVMRVVREPRPRDAAERRYLALPHAPTLLAYDAQTGDMVTQWVDGNLLAERGADVTELGTFLRWFHKATPTGIRSYAPLAAVRQFALSAPLAVVDTVVDALEARLEGALLPRVACHNDLNPWNVIVPTGARSPSQWCVLDWEFAGDNVALFDLVGLSMGLSLSRDDSVALARACDVAGSPRAASEHVAIAMAVFWLREHAWAVAQIKQGNDRSEIRAQALESAAALAPWLHDLGIDHLAID